MSMDGDGEPWLADLKNMERVVEIFELLGGRSEPQVANLVTPYRRWVRTDDVMLREAPFSANQKVPHRLYLFRDLLIIGRHKEPNRTAALLGPRGSVATPDASESKDSGNGLSKRRSFRLSFTRRKSTNGGGGVQEKRSSIRMAEDTYKVKLTHYLPLSQCTVKSIPGQLENAFGMQLTHVCRAHVDKDGKSQVVTRVEKLEFWFPTKDYRDNFELEMQSLIDEEEEMARDAEPKRTMTAVSLTSENTTATTGERSWAKNRPKSWKARLKESGDSRSRANSGDSEETTATVQREGISLADLAQRYNVDFAQKPSLENTAKFSVEFGEGQMGFSLSSGEDIGVIIGRLAPNSFAWLGGCEIGDRLESVNGVEIDMDMPWQRAVEVIKAAGRPVTLGFVRNVQVQAKVQEKEDAAPSASTPTGGTSGPAGGGANASAASNGRRKWAANRARHQSANGGLIALDDLEKMYKSTAISRDPTMSISGKSEDGKEDDDTGSVITADDEEEQNTRIKQSPSGSFSMVPGATDENGGNGVLDRSGPAANGKLVLENFASHCEIDEERICVSVLAEVLQTEKTYVSDLRALIREYVMPLRRATKRKKCKDTESASLMCEHGMLKSSCSKVSSESGPLLTADDVRTIFMNVETLVKVNAELLKAIEDGLNIIGETPDTDVSEGLARLVEVFSSNFEKITPFFTMYALYCHQYPAATERLQTVRAEDDEVDGFLRTREAKSSQNSLRSLLIKPVQRICRYPLLFNELLKRVTAVENVYPDRKKANIHLLVEVIQGTAKTVEKIANDVNQKVQVQETIGSIMTVFHELGGGVDGGDEQIKTQLLAPSRRFVRSEEVFFREAPFEAELQPRRLYLFNDLIILAQEKDGVSGGPGSHMSLKRKSTSGRLRARSFGRIMGGASMPSGSIDGNAAPEQIPWTHQATHWIELSNGDIRPLPKPDESGWYGFRVKSIKRTTLGDANDGGAGGANGLEKKKSTKRITWGVGVKESPPLAVSSPRVVTSIQKYEIWMAMRDKLQTLLSDIEDKIMVLQVLQQNASKGMTKFGAQQQRKTRSWIQKKASKGEDQGGLGGSVQGPLTSRKSTSGSIDARDALQTISKKYSGGLALKGERMNSDLSETAINANNLTRKDEAKAGEESD